MTSKMAGADAETPMFGGMFELEEELPSSNTNVQVAEEDAKLIEGFKNDLAHGKLSTIKPSSRPAPEKFDNVSISPPHRPLQPPNVDNNEDDDDDWDHIGSDEVLFTDGEEGPAIPSVIYQAPSVRATMQELKDRITPSEDTQKTLQAAWMIMKLVAEASYNIVSEPVLDAANRVVRAQYGTDLDGLPAELRARLMRSLPDNVQNAIRAGNRYVYSKIWGAS